MSAFFVATVRVKDPARFQDYAARAAETFQPFGGQPVLRGRAEGALAGTADHQAVGVVRFPDMRSLNDWYGSEDYQAIVPLRDAAADMTIVAYTVPE